MTLSGFLSPNNTPKKTRSPSGCVSAEQAGELERAVAAGAEHGAAPAAVLGFLLVAELAKAHLQTLVAWCQVRGAGGESNLGSVRGQAARRGCPRRNRSSSEPEPAAVQGTRGGGTGLKRVLGAFRGFSPSPPCPIPSPGGDQIHPGERPHRA